MEQKYESTTSSERGRFQRMSEAVFSTVIGGIILSVLIGYAGFLWKNINDIKKQNERISQHFEFNYPKGMEVITQEIADLKQTAAELEKSISDNRKVIDKIQTYLDQRETSPAKKFNRVAMPKAVPRGPTKKEKDFQIDILRRIPFEKSVLQRSPLQKRP